MKTVAIMVVVAAVGLKVLPEAMAAMALLESYGARAGRFQMMQRTFKLRVTKRSSHGR
tara:strand:+ start:728 stop:901 length:174 start_codon:yes stop_codon:yes gene_type:complete